MSRQNEAQTILNAKGANGAGNSIKCRDFRHAIFSVATDGGGDAAMKIKFQGSVGAGRTPALIDTSPAFGSAASVTNQWDYIEVIDYEDGANIDGDTGVTMSSADDYRLFEANINGLEHINVIVSSYSAGEVTVFVRLYND